MAFKQRDDFYESKAKMAREVPFLSEMTDDDFAVVVNSPWPITQVYKSTKGLLVITAMFKTFIFRKSSLYEKMVDAISDSVTKNVAADSIAVFVNNNKTVVYGEDDTYLQVWSIKENNFYATLVSVDGINTKSEEDVPF